MADPYKCHEEIDDKMMEQNSKYGWRIDTKWLLSQVLDMYLNGEAEVIFAVLDDDKMYMRGIRQTNKDGEFLPQQTWIEEFPPWP